MTLRLLLLEPDTVFTARVNQASFTYPLAEVTYDTGTTFGDGPLEGQTVFFGTSAGDDDLGRQRLRSGSTISTTGTLNFGRSSQGVLDGEVDLEDDAYITVFNLRSVWMKAPYIADDGTIYKDHDVAYSDQNEDNFPVANAGIGFARSLSGGSSINCDFDGTASFATADGASISSYLWDVDDGTITVGTATSSSITVNFPVGFRYVSLTVTDSNGKSHTTYVPVYCRDPSSDSTIQVFEIDEHTITPEGQLMSFRIYDDIPTSTYPNGTLIMLWEGEPSSNSDRSHMRFIGWHMTDPADIGATRTGTLRDTVLRCGDVGQMMRRAPEFPVEISSDSSPANWGQMSTPNMDKYLHFLLYWHSSALEVADWTDSGTGSNYPFVILGSDGESLWDQVQRKAKALVPDYILTCNRFGQLAVTVDPMLQDSGGRTATVQKALDEGDISSASWEAQNFPRVHWLRGEAIVADADNIAAIFCVAPGTAPGQGLSEQPSGEQLAQSQSDLNICEGHRYARLNAPNSHFTIALAGNSDYAIDPADMTWVTLTLGSSYAAQRGLTLSSERFLVREMVTQWEQAETGLVKTHELILEQETSGGPATTEIPPIIDDPPEDPGGDDWPGGDDDPPPIGWGTQDIAAVNADGYVYVTDDFQAPSAAGGPTWTRTNLSLSGTVYSFRVDPFCPQYLGTGTDVNGWIATSTNIYYVEDLFGSSPTVNNQHTFGTASTASLSFRSIWAGFGNFNSNQAIVCVISHYQGLAGHTGTWSIVSQDGGSTWGSEVQITAHYDSSGTLAAFPPVHVSPRFDGKIYTAAFLTTAAPATSDGYITTNHGSSWSRISNPDILPGASLLQGINVPWSNNADETYVYYGWSEDAAGTREMRTRRANGTTVTNITPTHSGEDYGPRVGPFSIVTYDGEPRYVALAGYANISGGDKTGLWVSDDHGDNWTLRVTPALTSGVTPTEVAFAGDTPDVLFAWGYGGYMRYSSDFGVTMDDRRGNIATDWSPGRFIGIAGGD